MVYVDEASFNCWMHSKRTWSTQEQPVKLVLNKTRNTGITVIGAVCKHFTKPLFLLTQTTNSADFHTFVTMIRESLPRSKSTTSIQLILDNHRAHHTNVVREYCSRHNIELTFQPSYSPEFNSIETLWSVVKRRFKQRLVSEVDVHITQTHFQNLLQEVLNAVTIDEVRNAASFNRKFLLSTLTEIARTNLCAENLQRLNQLDVVGEVSDESLEQSAQLIDRSINSYTLEVENVLNSPRTSQ